MKTVPEAQPPGLSAQGTSEVRPSQAHRGQIPRELPPVTGDPVTGERGEKDDSGSSREPGLSAWSLQPHAWRLRTLRRRSLNRNRVSQRSWLDSLPKTVITQGRAGIRAIKTLISLVIENTFMGVAGLSREPSLFYAVRKWLR